MFESSFQREVRIETWTLYAVGICLTALRFASQVFRLGLRNIRTDDWVVLTAVPWYTLLVVSINKIVFGGGSNYMTDDEAAHLTPEGKKERVIGSKWVLVCEQVMVLSIWTCKVCMLLIYKRLTQGLMESRIITGVMIYALVGFIATQTTFFTECRPSAGYWSVPPISHNCWSFWDFEIVLATFNVSSDIIVLCVAIPLILKLHIPVQQKIALTTVFGMGVFVIAAAILTKVFSLVPKLVSYAYLSWYFREASVSLYVVNLPALWALMRDLFPAVKSWGYRSMSYEEPHEIPLPLESNELQGLSLPPNGVDEELRLNSSRSTEQILGLRSQS